MNSFCGLTSEDWQAVLLSVRIAALAVLLSLPAGIALGWLLARKSFRGKSLLETLVNLPLVLAGLLTLATCVVLNLKLNFANIIALPLLLGIGVAFNIYFVVAWRAGAKHFLPTALARAVIFSALTTATGFGTVGIKDAVGIDDTAETVVVVSVRGGVFSLVRPK